MANFEHLVSLDTPTASTSPLRQHARNHFLSVRAQLAGFPYKREDGNTFIQNVGGDDYAAYLDTYGVIGTYTPENEEWSVCHANEGVVVGNSTYDTLEDALNAANELEEKNKVV